VLPDVFKNIKYDIHYKAIFSLFGIVLIISLFYSDFKDFPNKIQLLCFISIGYSLIAWFINQMLATWQDQMNELRGRMDIDYLGDLKRATIIHTVPFVVYIIVFFIVLLWR
jgi:hypothetical protein